MRPSKNSFSERNAAIPSEARKDEEAVYGEYTETRTDEAAAGIAALQRKREFLDGLKVFLGCSALFRQSSLSSAYADERELWEAHCQTTKGIVQKLRHGVIFGHIRIPLFDFNPLNYLREICVFLRPALV